MNTTVNEHLSPSTSIASIKSTDLRKMGSSIIRHCRRRTQSDPPKKYKGEKTLTASQKDKMNRSARHSMDGIIEINRDVKNGLPNNGGSKSNLDHHCVASNNTRTVCTLPKLDKSSNDKHLIVGNEYQGTLSDQRTSISDKTLDTKACFSSLSGTSNPTNPTTSNTMNNNDNTIYDTTTNNIEDVTLRLRKTSHCSQTKTTINTRDLMDTATSNNTDNSRLGSISCTSSRKNSTKSTTSTSAVFQQQHQTTDRSPADKSNCFSKFICCRRNRRKNSNTNSFKNNNVYPYTLEEYLRVPDSPLSSTADSRSTCFSSLSTDVNSVSSPTLSSSEPSQVFSSENSSTNLSHDSGFDEPKCFINMIYENHRCKGYYSCNKKDKASLNIHLKNLMNCMPKSFEDHDGDAAPGHLSDTLRHMSSGTSLNKRRNAICETSDDMKVKFYEALCSFMTLQAMAKYDFL